MLFDMISTEANRNAFYHLDTPFDFQSTMNLIPNSVPNHRTVFVSITASPKIKGMHCQSIISRFFGYVKVNSI